MKTDPGWEPRSVGYVKGPMEIGRSGGGRGKRPARPATLREAGLRTFQRRNQGAQSRVENRGDEEKNSSVRGLGCGYEGHDGVNKSPKQVGHC